MGAERIAAIHDYVEALGTALAQWTGFGQDPRPPGRERTTLTDP